MCYAPLWHLLLGGGMRALSVGFTNMYNERNLRLVGAVETRIICGSCLWSDDLHWDPDHC